MDKWVKKEIDIAIGTNEVGKYEMGGGERGGEGVERRRVQHTQISLYLPTAVCTFIF